MIINLNNISLRRLESAVGIRKKIEELESQLNRILSGDKRKNPRSAETRKKISEAMKERWSKGVRA